MGDKTVATIYFGGGTPSILETEEIRHILDALGSNFTITNNAEITLEANPDDMSAARTAGWARAGINRLSIGTQGFFDDELGWMNRNHDSQQAIRSIKEAKEIFNNISIDLIYGTPKLTIDRWLHTIQTALDLDLPHLSCYALTVEPRTMLHKMIAEKKSADIDHDIQAEQFLILTDRLIGAGYEHYEISNFAKPGKRSRHNASYWSGEEYLGLGPSAHSYNGNSRQWNVSNNNIYIESLREASPVFEMEELTVAQKLNEYIMTSLRTLEGMDYRRVESYFTNSQREILSRLESQGKLKMEEDRIRLTREGKLFADGIAAELFIDQ